MYEDSHVSDIQLSGVDTPVSDDVSSQADSDDLTGFSQGEIPPKDDPSQLEIGEECKDLGTEGISSNKPKALTYNIIRADPSIPRPDIKRYAHHGKRRRSYTEELFRCQHVTKVVSDELTCGALMWKNRPAELRAHLLTHMELDIVKTMSDEQVLQSYTDARRIFLEKLPDDEIFGIDEEDLDEDDCFDVQEGDQYE